MTSVEVTAPASLNRPSAVPAVTAGLADVVVSFSGSDPIAVVQPLWRERPGLEQATIRSLALPWGRAIAQYRPDAFATLSDRADVMVVGRPLLMDGGSGSPLLDPSAIMSELERTVSPQTLLRLSGLFAIFRFDAESCEIITDRMGFQPVYLAEDHRGVVEAIGTNVEALAAMTGRRERFDEASLAELLVFNTITFPYTTRQGITECPPGSVVRIDRRTRRVTVTTYWEPAEPGEWLSGESAVEAIRAAVKRACRDCTHGCQRVGIQLSAGRDSRVILAATPRERVTAALTFATRENREVRVARAVAHAAGVEHRIAWREPEWYASLFLNRGPRLLGTELKGNVHGLALVDAGLLGFHDVVLGGQLSDTLLKDHFMPPGVRAVWAPELAASPMTRLRRWLRNRRNGQQRGVNTTPHRRHALLRWIRHDLGEIVESRRRARLDQVSSVRPESATEWVWFWPASRQDDFAQTLGESRIMPFDGVFMHSSVLEVSASLHPETRTCGRAAHAAFDLLYAESELPLIGEERADRESSEASERDAGTEPWNDTDGSWVHKRRLQELSPRWSHARLAVSASSSAVLARGLLRPNAPDPVNTYASPLGDTMNLMTMQLVMHIARLRREIDGSAGL